MKKEVYALDCMLNMCQIKINFQLSIVSAIVVF